MPSSTIVHLVRHGEVHNPDHVVYADIPGFGLSALGHAQADEAGMFLAARDVAAVYSSPLQRATETAMAIARHHGIAITSVPETTEWLLAQRWKGLPWDALTDERPGELEVYLDHPLEMPFSPESLEELAGRMCSSIESITSGHEGQEIVFVSHQDPIQAARLALTHRTLGSLNEDKPGHAEVFSLQVGSPWIEVGRHGPAEHEPFPPR